MIVDLPIRDLECVGVNRPLGGRAALMVGMPIVRTTDNQLWRIERYTPAIEPTARAVPITDEELSALVEAGDATRLQVDRRVERGDVVAIFRDSMGRVRDQRRDELVRKGARTTTTDYAVVVSDSILSEARAAWTNDFIYRARSSYQARDYEAARQELACAESTALRADPRLSTVYGLTIAVARRLGDQDLEQLYKGLARRAGILDRAEEASAAVETTRRTRPQRLFAKPAQAARRAAQIKATAA